MSDLDLKESRLLPQVSAKMNFVVNEFPRIRVPKKQDEQEKFQEMNTAKQQMLMKRLIDHVKELED
jgi:hypothetical protein